MYDTVAFQLDPCRVFWSVHHSCILCASCRSK